MPVRPATTQDHSVVKLRLAAGGERYVIFGKNRNGLQYAAPSQVPKRYRDMIAQGAKQLYIRATSTQAGRWILHELVENQKQGW